MNKDFLTYEQATIVHELGFAEPCLAHYCDGFLFNWPNPTANSLGFTANVAAPLKSQFFRWIRERHGVFQPQTLIYETIGGRYGLQSMDEYDQTDGIFETYEEAEEACICSLLDKLRKKNSRAEYIIP